MCNTYLIYICWIHEWLNSHPEYAFLFFFFLAAWLAGFSLTRDWTRAPCNGSVCGVLTTGPPVISLNMLFYSLFLDFLTPHPPLFWLCIWVPVGHPVFLWITCFELSLLFWCQKSSQERLLGRLTLMSSWPLQASDLPFFHLESP